MAAKKKKKKKKQSTKNSQVGICYKLQTYKYVGGKRVGVVYGDRKIHNSLEGQNSVSGRIFENSFFI